MSRMFTLFHSGGYLNSYYEFVGVQSCKDVFTLYVLIWTLTSLNLVAFFTGILMTAVLGSVRLLVRHSQHPTALLFSYRVMLDDHIWTFRL